MVTGKHALVFYENMIMSARYIENVHTFAYYNVYNVGTKTKKYIVTLRYRFSSTNIKIFDTKSEAVKFAKALAKKFDVMYSDED